LDSFKNTIKKLISVHKSTALNDLKFVLILISLLFLLLSCEKDTKPAELLTEQQMILVLTDIHVAESALSIKNFTRDTSIALFQFYEEEIFKNRSVTTQQFKDSYRYYAQHSLEMDRIYAAVVDSLAVKESRGKLR
jgi:hypothetical protein